MFLVDDHELMRRGVAELLTEEDDLLGLALHYVLFGTIVFATFSGIYF